MISISIMSGVDGRVGKCVVLAAVLEREKKNVKITVWYIG